MDDEIRLLMWSLGWLRRNLARLAVSLTAVAVLVLALLALVALEVQGTPTVLATMGLALIVGLLLGMRWYRSDRSTRPTVADWLIVVFGVITFGFLAFSVIIFFALFGTLFGLYVLAVPAAAFLIVSLLVAERRKRATEHAA